MEFPNFIVPYVGNNEHVPVTNGATGEHFTVVVVGATEDGTVLARRPSGTIVPIQGVVYRPPTESEILNA